MDNIGQTETKKSLFSVVTRLEHISDSLDAKLHGERPEKDGDVGLPIVDNLDSIYERISIVCHRLEKIDTALNIIK